MGYFISLPMNSKLILKILKKLFGSFLIINLILLGRYFPSFSWCMEIKINLWDHFKVCNHVFFFLKILFAFFYISIRPVQEFGYSSRSEGSNEIWEGLGKKY